MTTSSSVENSLSDEEGEAGSVVVEGLEGVDVEDGEAEDVEVDEEVEGEEGGVDEVGVEDEGVEEEVCCSKIWICLLSM